MQNCNYDFDVTTDMETSSVPSTNASVGVLNNNINNTTTSNNNGGGGGGGANNSTFDSLKSNENNNFINGNKNSPPGPQSGQQSSQQQYTIPGILHFLQYEWQRFELERQQWDIERAELQARIALLQGERKGQENLKSDLVRRIKMLEYCLRQERAKYHKLKYGVDPPSLGADDAPQLNNDPLLEDSIMNSDMGTGSGALGVNWKHGRQLLRQYLQEIGYTDTIIDVRSNRVRSLLGLNNATPSEDGLNDHGKGVTQTQARSPRIKQQQSPASSIVADAEASVLATFEFLNEQSRDHARNSSGNEDDEDEEDDEEMADDVDTNAGRGSFPIDTETEEVLAEFDFLSAHPAGEQKDGSGWGSGNSKSDIVDIGELAALTVANESLDVNGSNTDTMRQRYDNRRTESSEFRKTWNPRYILKSHFDCVRCLRFHQTEPLLVTCSEDETLKLWNLNKTQQSNKGKQATSAGGTTFDLEPIYTYRGHTSRVLSLTLSNNIIYSGAQNGELFVWSIPSNISTIDPYDAYDASLSVGTLEGHTDAIWSLVVLSASNTTNLLLCSASADSTVRIWDASKKLCIKTITLDDALPTCLANIPPHNNNTTSANSAALLALSLSNGAIFVYDIESASYSQPILTFEDGGATSRINSIVVHPTMPVIVSAHEDRQIKFWDLNSGKCVHSMVAHLDEVTCLACDPNGLYLLSGSHDCSIRLWNFDNRTCVQEITSHRKKFDEAIFDVTFHLSKPYFASAGADGLAKVFV